MKKSKYIPYLYAMNENNRGGRRLGAGRKPTDNPKEVVTLYVETKAIYPFGNKDKLKGKLYDFISGYGKPEIKVQDLTKPTNEIKPPEQPQTNYAVNVPPKPEVPDLGKFEGFKAKILATRTVAELKSVLDEVKNAIMLLKEKKELEAIGKEHSTTMYTD